MYKLILVILGVLIVGCSVQEGNTQGTATLVIESIGNTTTQKYEINDVTAYELLDYGHDLKVTYGDYLKCIDDVCANKEYVWTFYVNDIQSSEGVERYIVKRGDRIEFKFNNGG